MANTYSQLYYHIAFAVKGRKYLVSESWQDELYQYITGVIRNKNQKLMIVNGMPDHVHLLIGASPNCNLSDLVRDVKSNSSKWINEKNFLSGKFAWQTGFGAFTISHSHIEKIVHYIKNQQVHHKTKTFREEYQEFLKSCQINFDERYIFN